MVAIGGLFALEKHPPGVFFGAPVIRSFRLFVGGEVPALFLSRLAGQSDRITPAQGGTLGVLVQLYPLDGRSDGRIGQQRAAEFVPHLQGINLTLQNLDSVLQHRDLAGRITVSDIQERADDNQSRYHQPTRQRYHRKPDNRGPWHND